jgi:phosphoribosyl 1,2-cyclic phosphodiesterase
LRRTRFRFNACRFTLLRLLMLFFVLGMRGSLAYCERSWYTRSVRFCVLSSGSTGNCLWVEAGGTRALFDAGLPLRETARRCSQAGISLRDVTDVFLTHEHADHAGAAGILARKLGVRVHATRGTMRSLRDPPPEELRFTIKPGSPLQIGALRVVPFAVPHDAAEPVNYVFEEGPVRAALVTDLGCAPRPVVRALHDLDALVLEMNHDPRLLLEGPYPMSVKQRVRSDHGHLSNEQGARLLSQILHRGLRHLVLAHLSEHNNTKTHARRAAEKVLDRFGSSASLSVGSQARALDPVALDPAGPAVALRRARQLALFA